MKVSYGFHLENIQMLKDPDYSKTFGYELTNVISFRDIPYALMFKISEPDSAL